MSGPVHTEGARYRITSTLIQNQAARLKFSGAFPYLMIYDLVGDLNATMPPDGDFRSPAMPDDIPTVPCMDPPPVIPSRPWRAVARAKQADRERRLSVRPEWRLPSELAPPAEQKDVSELPTAPLSPRERDIVRLDATALAEAIRTRRYTAVETIEAFCHAATIAQDLTNCLTEVMFDEAVRRAEELDRHLQQTGQVVGPLHGVPVSIKDHISVKGHDTSAGYAAWAGGTVAEKDATAVDILRRAGAVIYVKTANPQTLLVRSLQCELMPRISTSLTSYRSVPVAGNSQQHLRQDGQPTQPQSVFVPSHLRWRHRRIRRFRTVLSVPS